MNVFLSSNRQLREELDAVIRQVKAERDQILGSATDLLAESTFTSFTVKKEAHQNDKSAAKPVEPPRTGVYVLRFVLSREGRDAAIGDLLEEYSDCVAQHGRTQALFQYWGDIAKSVGHAIGPKLMSFIVVSVRALSGL